jgi:hypothetical protein
MGIYVFKRTALIDLLMKEYPKATGVWAQLGFWLLSGMCLYLYAVVPWHQVCAADSCGQGSSTCGCLQSWCWTHRYSR